MAPLRTPSLSKWMVNAPKPELVEAGDFEASAFIRFHSPSLSRWRLIEGSTAVISIRASCHNKEINQKPSWIFGIRRTVSPPYLMLSSLIVEAPQIEESILAHVTLPRKLVINKFL